MYLKPMRRIWHNIEHMYTLTTCFAYDGVVYVNGQIIAYHKAVKTWTSGGPPLCELFHDIPEELQRKITTLALEALFLVLEPDQWKKKFLSLNLPICISPTENGM